jgi:hypothetical protein
VSKALTHLQFLSQLVNPTKSTTRSAEVVQNRDPAMYLAYAVDVLHSLLPSPCTAFTTFPMYSVSHFQSPPHLVSVERCVESGDMIKLKTQGTV